MQQQWGGRGGQSPGAGPRVPGKNVRTRVKLLTDLQIFFRAVNCTKMRLAGNRWGGFSAPLDP